MLGVVGGVLIGGGDLYRKSVNKCFLLWINTVWCVHFYSVLFSYFPFFSVLSAPPPFCPVYFYCVLLNSVFYSVVSYNLVLSSWF